MTVTNAPAERSVGVTFFRRIKLNENIKKILAVLALILVILLISYAVFTAKQLAISEAAYEAIQTI